VRLGVVSDIHGNVVALDAVLADADDAGIDQWWALGDLALFGPRPVEVLERLESLVDTRYVGGNTDRYVVTGEQPHPHATAADAVGNLDLVEIYGAMAAQIGWTRGILESIGLVDWLAALPTEQRYESPDGSVVLGVHASPGCDDGPGIDTDTDDDALHALLAEADADVVVGGHTHVATNRSLNGMRACNPGSVGLPRRGPGASWMIIDSDERGVRIEHRRAPFDVDEVVSDLHRRRYPNASFVESVLRRTHRFAH
jgi:predicted phosphodiesterase